MYELSDLQKHPNSLAEHYQHFNVANRLLLTGHSHQAWPDCGLKGQQQAWLDAASLIDKKWEKAEEKAEFIRHHFARLLEDKSGDYALGQSTFDLVIRFVSALPLRDKPRLVTTDCEFHSLRRLLNRIAEEGIEVVVVPSQPLNTFVERFASNINNKTAAAFCSKVFFNSGLIVDNLKPIAERCAQVNCELLVDAYHAVNVVPFSIVEEGLEKAYVVGGGYKYLQLGEGNCFIRLPDDCTLRPVATGWYGEFDAVAQASSDTTLYENGPARFAGATYDPTSHYRAVEVLNFFQEQKLDPPKLRLISQHQINLLADEFLNLDLDPEIICLNQSISNTQRGGFIVFDSPNAKNLCQDLFKRGVLCDNRDTALRFGPAPYLSDRQCRDALIALKEAVQAKA